MNPVVHFEMPAKDRQRASKFYSNVFGWNMHQLGADMGNYVLAGTTEVDEERMPTKPGAINGGFFEPDEKNKLPMLTIAVDDIKSHIETVKKAGGQVEGEPVMIPGIGLYVNFVDPEGNRVSMLQEERK
jgi:uncharacterized protein